MIPLDIAAPIGIFLLTGLAITYGHLLVRRSELAQLAQAAMTCAHAALVGYLTWRYADTADMSGEEESSHEYILQHFSELQAHLIKGEYREGAFKLKLFVAHIETARVLWAEKHEKLDTPSAKQDAAAEELLRKVLGQLQR